MGRWLAFQRGPLLSTATGCSKCAFPGWRFAPGIIPSTSSQVMSQWRVQVEWYSELAGGDPSFHLHGFEFPSLHSIGTPLRELSRLTAVFPGLSVLSKPPPALSKCLRLKYCPNSQAGRRGFESRLPLHDFNYLTLFAWHWRGLEWSARPVTH